MGPCAKVSAMDLLPFGALPPYRPRKIVPKDLTLGVWANISPLFDQLEKAIGAAGQPEQLEQWLLDWSEVGAALEEESARRYIAMTCHTEDPEAEKAYIHFVEKIDPELKPRQFRLAQLFSKHPLKDQLADDRYRVLKRDLENQVALFRPENVELETKEALTAQQYQKLMGSLTVTFQGEEKTLVQMGKYQEEPDRKLRQETWELSTNRRLQEREQFENIFDQLRQLRQQIAQNAGFSNYRDYMFRKMGRFDYSPADCEGFHEAVRTEVMPVIRELQRQRREHMGIPQLRPWDTAVDPLGRPPLKPFTEVQQMINRSQEVFEKLDPELATGFKRLQEMRLLDLANRKGKAPGGYQSTLPESRLPFIFMNAVGVQRDVETILHEAGHAFHALAVMDEDLLAYRNPPIEFCEVASMSMELLGNEWLESFYAPAEANRARRNHLESVLSVLAWIATVDAFQHWIYTHPNHTRSDRAAAWRDLMQTFGGDVDWAGLEDARDLLWHRQLHIFLHPFYYIEYGIAQLGALQVWARSKQNAPSALRDYKRALSLGGSRPLPELFAAAGCRFEFSRSTIAPLVGLVRDELARLPA